MNETPERRRETGSDWVLPVAAVAFATYYLYSIRDLTWEAKVSGVAVAVVLYVLVGLFLAKSLIGLRRNTYAINFRNLYDDCDVMAMRLTLFALAVAYILVIPWLGFTLTTLVFLVLAFRFIAKMAWKWNFLISVLLALAGWGLFIAALNTSFPLGPLERTVRALTGF